MLKLVHGTIDRLLQYRTAPFVVIIMGLLSVIAFVGADEVRKL